MRKDSKSYFDDLHWEGKGSEFYKRYENTWIAVVNKQVVASGENLQKVEEEASCKTGKSKEEIAVQFVESPGAIYG